MDRSIVVGWALAAGACAAPSPAAQPPTHAEPAAAPGAVPVETAEEVPDRVGPEPKGPPDAEPGWQPQYEAVSKILTRPDLWPTRQDALAYVRRPGRVRLSAQGGPVEPAPGVSMPRPRRLLVIEEGADPVVALDDGPVRLLLFVERDDLHPLLLANTPLGPSPGHVFADPPKRGYSIVDAEMLVEVVEESTDAVKLEVAHKGGSSSGWVDRSAVGTIFTPGEGDPSAEPQGLALEAVRGTPLRERPGGPVLTRLGAHDLVVAITDKTTKGHRLVWFRYPCRSIAYVGFVRARDLEEFRGGGGYGCGSGGGGFKRTFGRATERHRIRVGPGRVLLAPDSDRVVGCVAARTEVVELDDGIVAVATMWGPIPVRLASEEMLRPCASWSPEKAAETASPPA